MIREIEGGGSTHDSQSSTIAHFGLGTATAIDEINITWVGGKKQTLVNQPVNTLLTIEEAKGGGKGSGRMLLAGLGVVLAVILLMVLRKNMRS